MIVMSAVIMPMEVSALNPDACNCVIFRLDDIQDYWLASVQTEIIDQFIDRNEDLSLGIVMNFVGSDPTIVNKVKEGAGAGILELTLHGWNHVDYQSLTQQEQYDTLQQANTKMQNIWGRSSRIFIPPYNSYNENTLAATSQLGLKIISSEFDQEINSVLPHPNNPNHPDNKIYRAFEGSNIVDQFGVYHMPQEIGFYDYEFEPPIKNNLTRIESRIDNSIVNYGYAVVTLHPQDFTIKAPDGNWTPNLDQNEIDDLNELITLIQNKGYHIRTFSSVANIPLPPLVDNTPPVITAPPDIALVSQSTLTTITNLGTPTVSDNTDTSPTVTNDAPEQFPQGTTTVTWTATDDSGNSATAKQYVTISTSVDSIRPVIAASTPASNAVINGPAAGVNIPIHGTASDGQSGVKIVEVRTEGTSYKTTKQDSPGSWSNWSHVLNVKQSGNLTIVSRATDFFNNQQWWYITPVTVILSGPDTTAPMLTPPPDIVMEATGPATVVSLGTPTVFDNSDLSPHISFNAPGAGESEIGFPVGNTTVTWVATDASGNSANATQLVTIIDTTPPEVPELLSPAEGQITSDSNVQLFWSDVTDLVSGVTYDLLVANNSSDFTSVVIDQEGLVASTYIPEIALSDGTYYWKVRALDGQDNESEYSSARTFTVDISAPTVTASPAGGTYASAQSITLNASEPATIYYTIDGSMPTTASTVYSTPIPLTANVELKFFAVDGIGNGGPISTELYILATTFASPSGGTYNMQQSVTISSWVPNATIYYTLDGSEPTLNSTVYTSPIDISENLTLRFFGVDSAGNKGAAVVEVYTFDMTAPTVSSVPAGGTYSAAQLVNLTASEPATIYYTIDGSQPDLNSTIYTGPVSITASADLKFFAIDGAGNAGTTMTESFVIDTAPPLVVVEPPSGLYNEAVNVTLFANEEATIYYTTDGSEPALNSTVYAGPIQISADAELKFFAVDSVGNAGTIESETYIFDFEAPSVVAEPSGGTFEFPQSVTLTASESATTIFYTTDGSEPTLNSTTYASPIDIGTNTTLRFFAKDLAGNIGSVQTETYTIIDNLPPEITAVPPGGLYDTPQNVTLLSDELATIYYTLDGSEPTTNSTVYSSPIIISDTMTLKYFGIDNASNSGTVQTQTYTFDFDTVPPTVTASPTGGTYTTEQSVTLAADEVATIYFTTDGSEPDTNSTVYVSPILLSIDATLKFFAVDLAGNTGNVTSESYHFDMVAPTVTAAPAGGMYSTGQTVSLIADEPATIFYTTDGSEPTLNSTTYATPISISANTTLKFFAVDDAGNEGNLTTQIYTFDFEPPSTTALPTGGTYTSAQTVSLSTSEPATIYYTIDGSAPSNSSNIYSSPIEITSTTTLKFFAEDSVGNAGAVATEIYTINTVSFPITHMSDTTASFGLATHSGIQSHVEFVSTTSQLVGKSIDQITLKLRKTGTPAGTIEVGVFNPNLSVKKSFGTIDAATIASTYSDYVFSLSNNELYIMEADDRIGIRFTGGNSNNFIAVMTDQDASDPFDGSHTYRQQFTTSWTSSLTTDLYMKLEQTHGATDTIPPTVTASPTGGTYTSEQFVTLVADEPATIYYTIDGSSPTTSSPEYSSPIAITENTTLKFFGKDLADNSGSTMTETYTIIPVSYPLTQMSDTTATFGLATNSAQQSHVEFVTSGSQLVGKSIDQITLKLRKTGAPTGTVEVGVLNSDLTVKELFGAIDAATVASVYTDYTFSLTTDLYTIEAGDRIGIRFSGGNSNNFIAIMTDQDASDPFDGANTYYQYHNNNSWLSATTKDLYMILTQTHG